MTTATPDRRQKIIQVTWSLVAGGMETYAFALAANLSDSRFESTLCPLDAGGALEPEVARRGIPYFVMHRRPGIDFRLPWRLYRLFRSQHADVVHTHHIGGLFYSALAARLAGARLIHTEHTVADLRIPRLRLILRVMSLFCGRIIAVGPNIAEALHKEVGIPAAKISVIHAGVDSSQFIGSKLKAREALGLGAADFVAVIVARLSPEKNHSLLLTAFASVVEQEPRAHLLIVGDGVDAGVIASRIESLGIGHHVQMLGVRRDIPRVLAAADVFVLSSLSEGLPIAVLEAMTAALPVVSTNVGDISTIVRDGETGYLVPSSDAPALAGAIASLFSNPQLAAQMGEAGKKAAAPFSLASMIKRYEHVYDYL